MIKSIGILGCGWLGTPLAEHFVSTGYHVKGSKTTKRKLESIAEKGILSYLIRLEENAIEGNIEEFLSGLDVLIINIPPNLRRNPHGNFVGKIEVLIRYIKHTAIDKVVFVSSTSVYGNINGEVTEETTPLPETNSGKQLLASEKLLFQETSFSTTVIRFGGLISEDRHPVHMLSRRTLTNGGELINLIHRNDCIHMISTIIKNGYWNEVFNGVYPYHPTKAEYYTLEAKKRGIPPPNYQETNNPVSKKKVFLRNFFVKMHELTTSISS